MQNQFKFRVNTNLLYGVGCTRNIATFLDEKKFKNLVILVDEGVADHSVYYQDILKLLYSCSNSLEIIKLRGTEEPDYDYLDEIAGKVRNIDSLQLIIGIGGGSCLDITKAVAVLVTNPGKGIEYRGFDKVVNPGIPTLAIPSTAGTASEVTINAVFIDKKEKKKLGINGNYLNATYAILDAEWTLSCSETVAVSAGMDAMTHTLESFTCNQANPLTRTFSKEAFRILYNNLPCLVDDPQNKEKRQQILLGAHLAGIALFNSGSGIAGALSYPIGVHYKVPHGIGGGIFLASVVEYNFNKGYLQYSELYDLVKTNPALSSEEKSTEFVKMMNSLSEKLNVPKYLEQWGINAGNVDEVARLMLPLQAAFNQNPVPFSAEKDAYEMLKKHTR